MIEPSPVSVAIVDYGLGNLFSIKRACEHTGMKATVTSSRQEMFTADVVILPGVGAFGDAMDALKRLDLVSPLKEIASSDRFLFGVCLGMQLLMTESYEFGRHSGLGLIEGSVIRLGDHAVSSRKIKVPQVGWNHIFRKDGKPSAQPGGDPGSDPWLDSPLDGVPEGAFMYFVHSFYVQPKDPAVILSATQYGDNEFCSALGVGNVFATQFHPERSASDGLKIYENIAAMVVRKRKR